MSAPLVVSIPHRLGKQEALRRLKTGLSQVRTSSCGNSASRRCRQRGQTSMTGITLGRRATGPPAPGRPPVDKYRDAAAYHRPPGAATGDASRARMPREWFGVLDRGPESRYSPASFPP